MQPENDSKPVTHAYLREVLVKVDKSLQEFSKAINKLQEPRENSDASTDKIIEIENQVEILHQKIQDAVRDDKHEDYDQGTFQKEFQKLELRLEQVERLEKNEEYEQNNLENDIRQLQQDFKEMDRKIRDIEYKLRKS